ncbi:MAG: hypothetical protein QOH06_1606 [Acidobacteriota bacterium]|jgi:PKD repeat protein|nr:hypothetical protein [Acidobacteriota bacterium]
MKAVAVFFSLLLVGGTAFAQGELFRLPLTSDTIGHYYFDHDTVSGCKDWQCDTSCAGSNDAYGGHTGTDFSGEDLDVLAAATGWIVAIRNDRPPCTVCPDPLIYDNFPPECRPFEGNWVRLQHSSGTKTSYLHMKMGTVIGKLYDRVECGELLGKSGSSGAACGAHLHFGLKVNNVDQDPYKGTCNNLAKSWWVNQGTGSPGTACAANPFKFANGNCIRTTAAVNVRDAAAGALIRQQASGSLGTIIGGPEGEPLSDTFYVWWRIRWPDGQEGWSIEDQLEKGQCGAPPSPPSNLAQVSCNGSILAAGDPTNADTVRLRGTVSGSAGSQLRLEIELQPRTVAFTGNPTHSSDPVSSGSLAVVKTVTSLANDDYHWRGRTVDSTNSASNWVSYGNNADSATDFKVSASSCILCSFGESARVFAGACGSPLSVSLSATPSSGTAPLADVDLTASVSGTATGTINYTFYCNRSDLGTDITPGWSAKFDGVTSNPKTAADVCDYSTAGTYTAKVIAERGAYAAEKRTTITVGQPSPAGTPLVTTLATTAITQSSASLNMTVNPRGSATSVWFDWGTSTSVSQSMTSQGVGAGSTAIPASLTLSGLSCGTTYYFRARAQNGLGGATPGAILSFPTAACGCGSSQSTELIRNGTFEDDDDFWTLKNDFYADRRFNTSHDSPGYAYLSKSDGSPGDGLNGEIYQNVTIPANATSATLTFWTRISTSEPAGGAAQDFLNATLQRTTGTFLSSLAIYSNQDASGSYVKRTFNLVNFIGQTFRIHFLGVTNTDAQPTVFRIDDVSLSITIPSGSEPSVTTDAADQITDSSARLNMTVDPNDAATTAWFDLEIDDSSPNTDTEHISIGCGSQSRSASISVYGLECNSTYYFEANAQNTHGSDDGSTRQFKTAACAGGGRRTRRRHRSGSQHRRELCHPDRRRRRERPSDSGLVCLGNDGRQPEPGDSALVGRLRAWIGGLFL